MKKDKTTLLQNLPGVDKLLSDKRIEELTIRFPRSMVVEGIRDYLENIRRNLMESDVSAELADYDTIVQGYVNWARGMLVRSLKRAVNGVGIILHTALGRAPLAGTAQKALMECVAHYCTLQADIETGKRGDRYVHVEELLKTITGAEAALVVNNNAAATMLILNTLAEGKEVIVSRGELVEIGGSFRIPDVMRRSGAHLVEVGATNRTHLFDYEKAITLETGLLLRVHQSNFRIIGFSKVVPLADLVSLAHERELPLVDDLGSGALVDLSRWGLPKEPTVQDSIREGSDIVCFSGDKLLGGPQTGIIVGKKQYIDRMKKNQLTRALRCDKMTFAVLEATLRLFLDEKKLIHAHPVLHMLTESPDDVKKRCQSLKRKLKETLKETCEITVQQDFSEVGSGSLTAEPIPTWVLSFHTPKFSAEELAAALRHCNPAVFGRIKEEQVILDCRTIRRDEFGFIVSAFQSVFLKDNK